jgi:hypothetical protein
LEDYVSDENPVRVIEAFIDELDLKALVLALDLLPEPKTRPPGPIPQLDQKLYLIEF